MIKSDMVQRCSTLSQGPGDLQTQGLLSQRAGILHPMNHGITESQNHRMFGVGRDLL